tara:strand:+ start:582 stop:1184 length:603 start_codon:yes stop_codon:yes gene_type:complete
MNRKIKYFITILCFSLLTLVLSCGGGDDELEKNTILPTVTGNQSSASNPGSPASATPFPAVPTAVVLERIGATPEPTKTAVDGVKTYVVVAGDSLSVIAEKYGTTVEEIQSLNDLNNTNIFVDQELIIPSTDSSTDSPKPTTTPDSSQNIEKYTVQDGDTGYAIALKFEITMEELASANGITLDELGNLQIGQELLIPTQ